jgi:DNA-binding PadR family transcriptional regulator
MKKYELDLGATSRGILPVITLKAIKDHPRITGLDLKYLIEQQLNSSTNSLNVDIDFVLHVSVLYPMLGHFSKNNLITSKSKNRSIELTITPEGEEKLQEWIDLSSKVFSIILE